MKVGDLVNPFWTSKVAGNTAKIGLCVYLGDRPAGESDPSPFRPGEGPAGESGLAYYTLLSSEGMIEIPTWHWELEVISECR